MRRHAFAASIAVAAVLSCLGGIAHASTPHRVAPNGGSPLVFSVIQYNSPGNDLPVNNQKLNAEWVTIYNPTAQSRPLTGFHVHDAGSNHHYTFGKLTIGPHKSVRLHTGSGTDGPVNRYWHEGNYVWNNDKDTATLVSAAGVVVDQCSWNDPGEQHNQRHC
jgi:hypothetical protein